MAMRWKLRERLTALILGACLIPLIVVIVYVLSLIHISEPTRPY